MNCADCKGKGRIELWSSVVTCGRCDGTGRTRVLPRHCQADPGLTDEEAKNADAFIQNMVIGSKTLTATAKQMLIRLAEFTRGPWSIKDHVTSVSQDGRKVTVRCRNRAEAYYYLE